MCTDSESMYGQVISSPLTGRPAVDMCRDIHIGKLYTESEYMLSKLYIYIYIQIDI